MRSNARSIRPFSSTSMIRPFLKRIATKSALAPVLPLRPTRMNFEKTKTLSAAITTTLLIKQYEAEGPKMNVARVSTVPTTIPEYPTIRSITVGIPKELKNRNAGEDDVINAGTRADVEGRRVLHRDSEQSRLKPQAQPVKNANRAK